MFEQTLQSLDFDQRYIAVQDQHVLCRQKWQRLGHGMACTQLLVLQHKIQIISCQTFTDQFGTVADDHVNACRFELASAVDNMAQHGVACHRMENLGQG